MTQPDSPQLPNNFQYDVTPSPPAKSHKALILWAIAIAGILSIFLCGGIGAYFANRIAGPYLRLAFGIFIVVLGCYLCFGAVRRLGWIA